MQRKLFDLQPVVLRGGLPVLPSRTWCWIGMATLVGVLTPGTSFAQAVNWEAALAQTPALSATSDRGEVVQEASRFGLASFPSPRTEIEDIPAIEKTTPLPIRGESGDVRELSRPEFPYAFNTHTDSSEVEHDALLPWSDDEELPSCDIDGALLASDSTSGIGTEAEYWSAGCRCSVWHRLSAKQRSEMPWGRRLYLAFSSAVCGCDDCYLPAWHLQQSSAFWIDSARPQNRSGVRYEYGKSMIFPDRAEYFWARVGGAGPSAPAGLFSVTSLDYHELRHFTETAHGNFSFSVSVPYRSVYTREAGHSAGFSDIQLGTKSLLIDTPLLQLAFQSTTTIPSANPTKGLGTGHVSLEPALLVGMAITERDYLQANVAEWIPIGGESGFQGAMLRWGVGWNRTVWQWDSANVITTNLECVGWSFQDGGYTDPVAGIQPANNESYLYLGPGIRWLLCGKYEFGLGGVHALSSNHFARNMVRGEVMMRY